MSAGRVIGDVGAGTAYDRRAETEELCREEAEKLCEVRVEAGAARFAVV